MKIFDAIRNLYVAATPEEIVRQRVLEMMIKKLGYPKYLLAVEKELRQLPHLTLTPNIPDRRADILSFYQNAADTLAPLLLIECKEQHLNLHAQDQLLGYNDFVQAPFVALASPKEIRWGYFNPSLKQYQFFEGLPSYSQLITFVGHA